MPLFFQKLLIACQSRGNEIVEYLIKHGADINARDKDGSNALHIGTLFTFFHN